MNSRISKSTTFQLSTIAEWACILKVDHDHKVRSDQLERKASQSFDNIISHGCNAQVAVLKALAKCHAQFADSTSNLGPEPSLVLGQLVTFRDRDLDAIYAVVGGSAITGYDISPVNALCEEVIRGVVAGPSLTTVGNEEMVEEANGSVIDDMLARYTQIRQQMHDGQSEELKSTLTTQAVLIVEQLLTTQGEVTLTLPYSS